MQTYVNELAARLPLVAPDLRFVEFTRSRTLSLAEQTLVPWRLWRARARLVHFLSPYAPLPAPHPFAITIHDLIHLRFPANFKPTVGPYYRTIVRAVCAGARVVLTDDPRTVPDLERFLGVPPAKVRVVPLGADDRFMRDGIVPERAPRPFFLYAGNHREHKDLPTLFAAWAALPPELEADLWLTGDDDLPAGTVRPRRARGELRFLGEVELERLASLYAGTQALVYPSLCEGFGLPMLEAAAAGARVIASSSAVPHGLAPYVETFEPGDVPRLAALMVSTFAGGASNEEARRYARSQTWDRCAQATAEVYREIVQSEGIGMRRVARGLIGLALGLALAVPAAAGPTPAPGVERPIRTIALIVNGTVVPTDTPPRVEDGRLLVPLRVVLDALGLNVSRAGSAIAIRLPSGSVALTVGSNHVSVDGKDFALDAAVADYDGSTYAPLRLLKVALGASATYDQHDAKVTIVSALIGRAAGAEEQRSDGGTMVNGTIAAIDANSIPPALTVTLGPQARTISINSDARISVEDVTVHSQVKALLGDLRVGDRVTVRLAKDGRVIEIADFYSSDSGTLSAVSPAAIVLQNGKVVQPGKTSDITLNGASAGLGDLRVGDFVTVRRNPETGEIRQIIAARTLSAAPTQQPAAPNVVIKSFAISATRALRAGESFDVVLEGTPGGRASFDIGDYVADLPLRETAPGTYRASFTIPDRFNVTQVPVYGRLSLGGGIAPRAEASSTLSAATIPPQIPEVAPLPGESVNNVRPSIYATFVAPSAIAVNPSSVTLSVNGHDVTSSATRTASFITYRPGVDLPRGAVEVTVKVADAAGNTASRSWTFTIGSK